MSLGRYPSEVRAIADELAELLVEDYPTEARSMIRTHGDKTFRTMSPQQVDAAIILLSQTPSQRAKKLKKLSAIEACSLVLRARYLGLMAAQAMHFADRFEMVPGKGYRAAARFAAQEVSSTRMEPTLAEVFTYRLMPSHEDFDDDDEDTDWWKEEEPDA